MVKHDALEPIDDCDCESVDELPPWTEPLDVPERQRTRLDRLLRAVLLQAVSDLRAADADIRESAEAFFSAPETDAGYFFTFTQLAAHFGLDADAIRASALPRLRIPLPPGRRRPRNDE